MSTCKAGKHGHTKCNFVAIDISTGDKLEDVLFSHSPVLVLERPIDDEAM